jgi:hypothetical protein
MRCGFGSITAPRRLVRARLRVSAAETASATMTKISNNPTTGFYAQNGAPRLAMPAMTSPMVNSPISIPRKPSFPPSSARPPIRHGRPLPKSPLRYPAGWRYRNKWISIRPANAARPAAAAKAMTTGKRCETPAARDSVRPPIARTKHAVDANGRFLYIPPYSSVSTKAVLMVAEIANPASYS